MLMEYYDNGTLQIMLIEYVSYTQFVADKRQYIT